LLVSSGTPSKVICCVSVIGVLVACAMKTAQCAAVSAPRRQ
jgi:hypothetical protein